MTLSNRTVPFELYMRETAVHAPCSLILAASLLFWLTGNPYASAQSVKGQLAAPTRHAGESLECWPHAGVHPRVATGMALPYMGTKQKENLRSVSVEPYALLH